MGNRGHGVPGDLRHKFYIFPDRQSRNEIVELEASRPPNWAGSFQPRCGQKAASGSSRFAKNQGKPGSKL